ncbi:MAG: hypothetical protein M0T84_17140 [Betaproteobacteria bacterium]|nr:hypothetical protein [Betaproteobacteria bacterium]
MPKYAWFNPSANPSPILGWLDTDNGWPNLPPEDALLLLTDTQWATRDSQAWQVQNRQLTPAPDPSLADLKTAKAAAINASCQAQIFAGFTSSALGNAYTYPAKDRDQSNLAASVLASLLPNLPAGWTTSFWCMNATGAWAYVAHTAVQIQQVGQDGKTAVIAALSKNADLQQQIVNATTATELAAITW